MAGDKGKKSSPRADEGEDSVGGSFEGLKLTDAIKKIVTAGVSAAFVTEESLRSYLGEVKMPKEVLQLLLQGANKTKDEIALRVTNEVVGIIKKIDFVQEASRFVEDHKFRVTAEIEVIRKDKTAEKNSKV